MSRTEFVSEFIPQLYFRMQSFNYFVSYFPDSDSERLQRMCLF